MVPVSVGELLDKISILRIKLEKIPTPEKLVNVRTEYDLLTSIMHSQLKITEEDELFLKLYQLNLKFWEYHDWQRLRWKHVKDGEIDFELFKRTREEHELNDERAKLKREINEQYQSEIIEEKFFTHLKI